MEQLEVLGIWLVIALVTAVIVYRAHQEKGKVISDPGSVYRILRGK